MNEPRITVIIPTRERCDVLEKSLRTVTAQAYENLSIIVSDNCSRDDTKDIVLSTGDHRVQYLNTGQRISMSHNWEFALSHVTEGWVTVIGDDDGLLPDSLETLATIIRSTDAQAIRSDVCSYLWPSLTGEAYGSLRIPLRAGSDVRESKVWLSKVLSGKASYVELPMLYTGGFVDMSAVKRIKRRTGAFFLSCIPDVYSAVAIASSIDRYVYMHEPLAINGASIHSTGTSQFSSTKTLDGDSTPAHTFVSEPNIPFHADLPLCADGSYPASLQALVYESYLQSRCLRPEAEANVHSQQLAVILATSGTHSTALSEWGRRFARQHGLDSEAIARTARRRRGIVRVRALVHRLSSAMQTRVVGSHDLPIKNVYDASIAVPEIRDGTNRWGNVWRRALQLANPR